MEEKKIEELEDNPFSKKVKPLEDEVKVKELGNRNEDPMLDSELIGNIGLL